MIFYSMKIEIEKRCKRCEQCFKTSVATKVFCSVRCRTAWRKEMERKEKIRLSNHETLSRAIAYRKSFYAGKAFLKVKEAAFLLRCSGSAVYKMINTNRLNAINPSVRLIRIQRQEIFSILDECIRYDHGFLEKNRLIKQGDDTLARNYYRIDELTAIFKKSKEAMYAYCSRNGVSKIRIGREIFLDRHDVGELYRKFTGVKYAGFEKEREANLRLAKKKFRKEDCYSMKECTIIFGKSREHLYGLFSRRGIPKLKIGRGIFIPTTIVRGMFNLIKKGGIVKKVTLRKKQMANGKNSLFLDVYPPVLDPDTGAFKRKHYLKLFVYDHPKTEQEKQHNREILMLAESIKAKWQIKIYSHYFSDLK